MTSSPSAVPNVGQPRVCSYPPYVYSSGDDAIDLADLAGLRLDPWQQLVLRHSLGERRDGNWSAFQVAVIVARQNGKGAILEARELAGLFLFDEKLILHSAHEYRTAMEAFLRVRALIDNCDDLRRKVKRIISANGEEGIELLNGNRLRFISRSKGAGRGFSADTLIWDEAYALTEEQVEAQMPVLSARPNGQIWYTSSPPLDAVTGAQLFRVRRRAMSEPGSLAYFDWGAEGCLDNLHGVDLDDRALWRASNPAYGYRITEEAIERERGAMSDPGFARERLSIWPPDLTTGFRVIPEGDWQAAFDPKSQIHGGRAFGISASWDRGTASIGAAGKRKDGLLHVELVDARPGTGWVVDRMVRLKEKWRPCAVVVDPGGPAGSLIPQLEAAGVEVTTVGLGDVARAYGLMFDGVSGRPYEDDAGELVNPRNVRHIGQPELTAAVAGATNRTVGDGHAWDLKGATVNLTPLVCTTNALWGFALKGHQRAARPRAVYA